MGNNTSTDEKMGGGLLAIWGILLLPTPVGMFVSPALIGSGGALLTGKSVGAGVTYTDDGKGTQPYIGNPDDALRIREKVVEFENKRENVKRILDNAKIKFNVDKLSFNFNTYCSCVESIIKKNPEQNKTSFVIKTFDFQCCVKTADFFTENLHIFKSVTNQSSEFVDKIYVIRRQLDTLPIYAGWFAHSGLLIKTNNDKYYICEYGAENNQNVVSLYEIPKETIWQDIRIFHDGRKWNKQYYGSQLDANKKISVASVKETMQDHTKKHLYSKILWNCHIAQETTREKLGLEVKNKYFDEQYQKEYDIMLGCF